MLDIKGILTPIRILGAMFEDPNTIEYPKTKKEVAKGYRGFHTNLLKDCIGCASCQDICMNEAIDMIKTDKEYNPKNSSQTVPRVDYGRCCWCSLCTDVCPTNSLKLEESFLGVNSSADNFLYMPKDK